MPCCGMTHVPSLAFLLSSNESSFIWLSVDVDLSFSLFVKQDYEEEEDAEAFDVSLTKNTQGLGITIAGYVADKNSG